MRVYTSVPIFRSQISFLFQEFICALDAVTCKTTHDKLRWAFMLFDQRRAGSVARDDLTLIVNLMDQVEEKGFINGATEDEADDLLFKRKLDPLKLVDDRVTDIWVACDITAENRLTMDDFLKRVTDRIIYARD